jgi:ethanolamine utilization protein EutA
MRAGSEVTLVGLDVGSTTTSAVVAAARIVKSHTTGKMRLGDVRELFRSPMNFTPLQGERIDLERLEALVRGWLAPLRGEAPFGGGALLTGLAAQRENAAAAVGLIRSLLGEALVATADDPRLESWLAFMGAAAPLSRRLPGRAVLNLDIGGGTTNLALGLAGEVRRTGVLFVGARHVRVTPGTYRIESISAPARELMARLGIRAGRGMELRRSEVDSLLDAQLTEVFQAAAAQGGDHPIVTVSGGVGELIYAHMNGAPWPATTAFGDLGIDLARRLVERAPWSRDLSAHQPENRGRATVLGLLKHAADVSGKSLYLPRPELLPFGDLPILGRFDRATPAEELAALLALAARCPRGACLKVAVGDASPDVLRELGAQLAAALQALPWPKDRTLVLLARENIGKALGGYATAWGRSPANLMVIDELDDRDGQYAQIGACVHQVVPVAVFGLT